MFGWEGITKISEIVLIAVLLLVCAVPFAQTAPDTQTSPVAQMRVDETTLPVGVPDTQAQVSIPVRTNTIWLFVRMILVLALVVAVIYGLVALLKRGINPSQTPDPYLKSVASINFGPSRGIRVITVGTQAFLIGISENAVNLIGELTDKELVDAMNLNADREPQGAPRDFASLFSRFIRPHSSAQAEKIDFTSYFPAAEETQDYLRRRREELHSAGTNVEENDENSPR